MADQLDTLLEKFTAPGREAGNEPIVDTQTQPDNTEPAGVKEGNEPVVEKPKESDPGIQDEPAEEVSPEVKAPDGETKAEIKEEESASQEVPEYLKKFQEFAGDRFEVKSEEDIQKFLDNYDKISEEAESLRSRVGIVDEVEKWVEEEGAKYDPKARVEKIFGEGSYEKVYVADAISKKMGGNFDQAYKFVTNVDKMSDIDVRAGYIQFLTPGTSQKDAIEYAYEKAGVDLEEVEDIKDIELTSRQKLRLAEGAAEVRRSLKEAINEAKSSYKEPENPIKNINSKFEERSAKVQELSGQWEEAVTPMKDSFDKILIDEDFSFEIPEAERDEIVRRFFKTAAKQGMELNDANKQKVLQRAKDYYADKNRKKIQSSYRENLTATLKKKWDAEHKNLQPLGTSTPPPESGGTDANAEWRKRVGLTNKK